MSYNEHLTSGLAGLWNCTTNEAAERIAPKRKRLSHDVVRGDVPWTEARCNRLLRAVTSRINILRKQSKLGANGVCMRQAESFPRQETPSSRRNLRGQTNDPAWLPGARSKATARTYGGKSKPQARPTTQRVDSGFSTPFVKRLLEDETSSTKGQSSHPVRLNDVKRQPAKMQHLPVQLASSNEEAQRNLVTAFKSLLTTTNSPSQLERTGARSLLSTCLSRVPDYIDLEAEYTLQSNADAEDIASSVYTDLESLGTNSNGGWQGLREVVRSHSVHLVCTAIEEGFIHDARVAELVAACKNNSALAEAESLIRSWLYHHRTGASHRLDESNPALVELAELRISHDALELYLRQYTELINSDRVWVVDVLRPGSSFLKDLIKALVRGPGQEVAIAYLEAAVVKDCETSDKRSLPVFTRLAGLLASIALTRAGDLTESLSGLDLSAVVHRIAIRVMQYQFRQQDFATRHNGSTLPSKQSNGIHPFVMADTLLQLARLPKAPSMTCVPMDISVSTIGKHQHAFVKFVCNVAHHVSRFSEAGEIESLLLTTSGFLSPSSECSDENRDLLSRLGFEIAFAFSEQTGVDIDHRFADTIAANHKDKNPRKGLVETPRRRAQVSGFKWEEGLCEWVAATPLPLNRIVDKESNKHAHYPSIKEPTSPKHEHDAPSNTPKKSTTLALLPSSPDIIAAEEQQPEAPKQPITTVPKTTAHPNRPALKERTTNKPLPPKQVRFSRIATQKESDTENDRKPPRLLKPVVPKQVHLKVERAKRAAALLLAQTQGTNATAGTAPGPTLVPTTTCTQAPPPKQLKRSLSFSETNKSGHREDETSGGMSRVSLADPDELGLLTPVRKKRRSTRSVGGVRFSTHSQSLDRKRLSLRTTTTLANQECQDGMSDDELGL